MYVKYEKLNCNVCINLIVTPVLSLIPKNTNKKLVILPSCHDNKTQEQGKKNLKCVARKFWRKTKRPLPTS
jgi:hypothetical protein